MSIIIDLLDSLSLNLMMLSFIFVFIYGPMILLCLSVTLWPKDSPELENIKVSLIYFSNPTYHSARVSEISINNTQYQPAKFLQNLISQIYSSLTSNRENRDEKISNSRCSITW